jgi:hypothetical protein
MHNDVDAIMCIITPRFSEDFLFLLWEDSFHF